MNPSSEGYTLNQKGFNTMMIMTETLANSLMDDLIELAVFAIGHSPQEEEKKLIEEYARKTFLFLCSEWADLTGEDWQVLINK